MKKRKILAILLSLMLIVSSIPAFSLTSFAAGGEGIDTLDELKTAIAAGEETITITGDIDFGGVDLTEPIGTLKNGVTLDGGGYTFKNVSLKFSGVSAGLFAVEANANVTIKNLNIGSSDNMAALSTDSSINKWSAWGVLMGGGSVKTEGSASSSDVFNSFSFTIENVDIYANISNTIEKQSEFAGFIGKATLSGDSYFKDCNFYGSVENNSGKTSHYYAAGFVGVTAGDYTISFENCSNNASAVQGATNCGGFIGENGAKVIFNECVNNASVTVGNSYAGGFIAKNTAQATFSYCVNNAAVDDAGKYCGGILGYNTGAIEIINCVNTDNGAISGSEYVGGIVGASENNNILIMGSKNHGTITAEAGEANWGGTGGILGFAASNTAIDIRIVGCTNYGTVSGPDKMGGIVGTFNSTGNATVTPYVEDCVNIGAVTATASTGADGVAAGIVGRYGAKDTHCANNTLNISNCINLGVITSAYDIGAIFAEKKCANGAVSITDCATTVTVSNDAFTENVIQDASVDQLNEMTLGYFYNDNGTIKLNEQIPQFIGTQTAIGSNGTYDVRFVAVLKNSDLEQYANVGFKISAKKSDGTVLYKDLEINCTTVFTSLLATATSDGNTAAEMKTYKAGELAGDYIFALAVTGFSGDVEFSVQPYATSSKDSITTFNGVAWTMTYSDGAFVNGSLE